MFDSDSSGFAGYVLGNALSGDGGQSVLDQYDIRQLYARISNAEAASRHNYECASEYAARADRLEQEKARLTQENAVLKARVAEIERLKSEIARMRRERDGLLDFMHIAGHLLQRQRAGKASLPQFAELREYALDIARIHVDGEIFGGYQQDPKKLNWVQELWDALR